MQLIPIPHSYRCHLYDVFNSWDNFLLAISHGQGRGRGEQRRGQYPGCLQDASIKHVKYCQGRRRGEQGRGQYPGGLQDGQALCPLRGRVQALTS
jgi:hypothetical protein